MTTPNDPPVDETTDPESPEQDTATGEEADGAKAEKLDLTVKVAPLSACQRHVTVTVGREDIERYFGNQFSELMDDAEVPGFRKGRAPRKLVESRFRKQVGEQVKGQLLMDGIAQVNEDENLSAISEPDLDVEAVKLPDEGSMTFEYDLEVRPDFKMPKWKGLSIQRPTREFTREDVDARLRDLLTRYGQLVPHDGPAESGDYITTNLTFRHGDEVISSAEEEVIRIRPVLSFRDGRVEGFDDLMAGVKAEETRTGEARLTESAPNAALRGQAIEAAFEVLEVKKLELPELTPEFLDEMGGFETEGDMRDAIADSLQRQMEYEQQQRAREQVTAALTEAADWELPPEMLERQSHRELERAVMELRRSGFTDEEIAAHENELRQNSQESTARALKEHFILERLAEDEEIDAEEKELEAEIVLIAQQSNESVRRVRARLEKGGHMDVLRNQVVERKVIDLILKNAKFEAVPYELETSDTEAVDQAAGGGEDESAIPEAKYEDEAEPLREAEDHT